MILETVENVSFRHMHQTGREEKLTQNTNGDHELVRCDYRATNFTRANFGLVHGNTNGQDTNANTSDDTTYSHVDPALHGSDLDSVSDNEDDHTNSKVFTASEKVGSVCTSKRTAKSTDRHEGDKQRRDGWVERDLTVTLVLSEAVDKVAEQKNTGDLALFLIKKLFRRKSNHVEAYSIVTEKETTYRSDHTKHNGFDAAGGTANLDGTFIC